MARSETTPVILGCWKEIAQYLGKGVRTAQRWEQEIDLPVRRPQGKSRKSSVVATRHEIDAWLEQRWLSHKASGHKDCGRLSEPLDLREAIANLRALRELREPLFQELVVILRALVDSDCMPGTTSDIQRKYDDPRDARIATH